MILYLVLFLPGALSAGALPEIIEFSISREFSRLLLYSLPACALVWRCLLSARSLREWDAARPRVRDLRAFLYALPSLLITGIAVSLLFPLVFGNSPPPRLESPVNPAGRIILALSCLGTGYLEESYFRFYLLTMPERAGLSMKKRFFVSVMLFSFCHIYEGPAGAVNALIAGSLLALIFIRERTLHGIAWAHGAYNFIAYILEV